ncbi:MAG: flagellar basal body-associated FliL family protein [Gammaproteobacteria bacterium]|nr:flagellar basal body-associated FliL family protein [Gammaproteobacteria bacterium]
MQKLLLPIFFSILVSTTQVWAAEDDKTEGSEAKNTAYVSLGDAMVMNLSNDSKRLTFLRLQADLLLADSASEALITTHLPAIRHELIVLLSEQSAIDMKSPSKREEIRKIATAQIKEKIVEMTGNEDISELLFSSFLVQ